MTGTLDGIRIIDMTTVILGPWATQMLGDMGADVIKVETPGGDTTRNLGPRRNEGMASLYLATNRNKRSIVLDLTRDAGHQALLKIVATADVFLHNLRPKVARKLGLEYETFAAAFPDLIYCATYGFRRDGPMADKPAYDDVIQAACDLADLQTVTSDQPRYVPTILADKTTAFNVVSAILAGLLRRERGGGGQAIEVPMFESMVDFVMVEHLYGASFEPPIAGMGYARILNTERKPYVTKDGYLSVLPYTDDNWRDLLEIAGPRGTDRGSALRHRVGANRQHGSGLLHPGRDRRHPDLGGMATRSRRRQCPGHGGQHEGDVAARRAIEFKRLLAVGGPSDGRTVADDRSADPVFRTPLDGAPTAAAPGRTKRRDSRRSGIFGKRDRGHVRRQGEPSNFIGQRRFLRFPTSSGQGLFRTARCPGPIRLGSEY